MVTCAYILVSATVPLRTEWLSLKVYWDEGVGTEAWWIFFLNIYVTGKIPSSLILPSRISCPNLSSQPYLICPQSIPSDTVLCYGINKGRGQMWCCQIETDWAGHWSGLLMLLVLYDVETIIVICYTLFITNKPMKIKTCLVLVMSHRIGLGVWQSKDHDDTFWPFSSACN